jgi:hypothetical protein
MKTLAVLGAVGIMAIAGAAKADTTINFSDKSDSETISNGYGNSGNITTTWTGTPTAWTTGYGDLSKAVYGPGAGATMSLTLSASSGYQVLLKSFDLADYNQFNSLATITVSVDGGAASAVPGSGNAIVGGSSHNSFTGLTYVGNSSITLSITETDGNPGQDLGLDNIVYGQQAVVVPEPAALSLMGLGVLGLIRRRRPA